ncbi:MAG: right-handed parallel beta-helix repeat-containing protein [Pseudomonadota bacterium]
MIITVTTQNDIVDALDGEISLREAVNLANATEGFNEIVFKVDGFLGINGGQMQITDDVSINGDRNGDGVADVFLYGNMNSDRMFEVTSGAALSLSNLFVRSFRSEGDGGALLVNAGSSAAIDNVDLSFNSAGPDSGGGAIASDGSLSIRDSVIGTNSAALGGAIQSTGTLEIVNTEISDNSTIDQSGTVAVSGTATIVNSSIIDNTASAGNGALLALGSVELVGATIANNTSGSDYAAIEISGVGSLVVDQSTITGHLTGGIETSGEGDLTLRNSIVSGNGTDTQRLDIIGGFEPVLEGRNIIGDRGYILGTTAYTGIAATDIFLEADTNFAGLLNATRGTVALNPFFEPANLLRAFGGNYGEVFPDDTLDADGDGVTGEQLPLDGNGGYRNQGLNGIEIGAVEAEDLVVTTRAPGSANDGLLSLEEAIALAEANDGFDRITFDASVLDAVGPGDDGRTISLDGQFTISDALEIEGDVDGDGRGDIRLDAGGQSRHFTVDNSGTLIVNGITFSDGYSGSVSDGGSILNRGTLTVTNSVFEGNNGPNGGALFNSGSAYLGNVTFDDNDAISGGGAISTTGNLTVINGTFVNNMALSNSAGAIYHSGSGTAEILHSTITDNSAVGSGGGIYVGSGSLRLESSIVTGNTASPLSTSNLSGTIVQVGYNLIDDTITLNGNYNSDYGDVDVFDKQGDLGDHGGPVPTAALAAGTFVDYAAPITRTDSFDIDRDGDFSEVIDSSANGAPREPGANSSLGAFQQTNTLVVTTLLDESFGNHALTEEINDGDGLSLREALGIAQGTAAAETITFASDLMGGTIQLSSQLNISDTVTVDGDIDGDGKADITLDADGIFRVIGISAQNDTDSDVTLNGLTITDGVTHTSGGGIYLSNAQSLTLTNSSVVDNFAQGGGGGIFAQSDTTLVIENSLISGNTSESAGAGLSLIGGRADIFNTTIANNDTDTDYGSSGGGIYTGDATVVSVESSTITDNSAYSGGGIENKFAGGLTVTNSIISGNAALFAPEVYNAPILQGTNIIGTEISSNGSVTGSTSIDRIFAETQEVVDFFGNGFQVDAGVLRDNGGAVRTVALLRGGDAIDIGDVTQLDVTKTTDARGEGFARIVGPKEDGTELDVGAYEEQIPDQPALATVDPFIRLGEDGDTTTGSISIDDPDAGDNPSFANAIGTPLGDDIGDLQINAAGDTIEFTLDTSTVQDLNSGEAANVRYELFADDGTRTTVLVNIRGADDGTEEDDDLGGSFVADIIDGLGGDDTLQGFAEDDLLIGGEGGDDIDGGSGNDTASFAGSFNLNRADLQGLVTPFGDAIGDTYTNIENLEGGERIDLLFGDSQDNIIDGSKGNDRTIGRAGDDTLIGDDGFDKLYGNSGSDLMSGGGNRDRFIYFAATDSKPGVGNRDIITDFDPLEGETIEIGRLDADETRGGNQMFEFIGTDQFTDAGQVRFFQAVNSNITVILVNTDDDTASEMQIELSGIVDLTVDSFIL